MSSLALVCLFGSLAFAAVTAYDFKLKDIEGKDADLAKFKGKVCLMVNVASRCGYTPQYEEMQKLYDKYKEKGLIVAGFPANEFGGQEPGTNEEIKEFCSTKFKVTFPMFAKIVVKGEGIVPLYKFLTSKEANEKTAGDVKWNFTKFLVGKDGKVLARFESKVKPMAKELTDAIDAALAAK